MRGIGLAAALAVLLLALPPLSLTAAADMQGVVAVVNDVPVTERDLVQRITLLKFLGDLPPAGMTRKDAMKAIIDEQVKIAESNRLKLMPSEAEITGRIALIAKDMKLTPAALLAKVKEQGIAEAVFRRYLGASMGFNRIIGTKYQGDIKVSDSAVDAKLADLKSKAGTQIAKIMNDPRMKPVTVYSLMVISLPVESDDPMLLQSRSIEAQQYLQNFKGCGSAKAAADGIFNVKIGKPLEADGSKLPPPMRSALDKAGPGKAVGPVRGKQGLEVIAYCGSRSVTPPKPDFKLPTRDQVKNALVNEKYDGLEEQYLKTIRANIYVEFRDQSYAEK